MKKSLLVICGAMGLLCASSHASATTLAQKADGVVVGEVVSGTQTGDTASFVLRVDRALKGTIYVGSLIDVEYQPLKASNTGLLGGDYGIWFLQASGPGQWRSISAGDTHAPLALGLVCEPMPKGMPPPPVDSKNLSPDDMVATELSYAVEHFDYHGVQFYQLASGLLAAPSSAAVTLQYRRLMRSADPKIRLLGEVGLVQQGDPSAIEELPQFQETLMRSNLRVHLLSAFQNIRSTEQTTIDALGRISTSSRVLDGIQLAAAGSLRAIHT
jgi:hypothetical protein